MSTPTQYSCFAWRTSKVLLPLMALMVLASSASAKDEFAGFAVEKYNGSDAGECSSTNLTWTIEQVKNFSKKFSKWSTWETVKLNKNKGVDGRDFTDSSKDDFTGDGSCYCSACSCKGNDDLNTYGADHADVVVISTHGGRSVSGVSASLVMGDNTNDCKVTWKNNMYWDSDTDILITEACHSADYEGWEASDRFERTGFYAGIKEEGQFRALLGYHGLSKDKMSYFSAPGFVDDSYEDGIAENWVTEMYDSSWKIDGVKKEICPTAIVFGSTNSLIENFAENGGFKDRKDTGDKSQSIYFYIGGCAPHSASELPD